MKRYQPSRRTLYLILTALAIIVSGIFFAPVPSFAVTKLTVRPSGIDAGYSIRNALEEARLNASANNPYEITISPGRYAINTELAIYSYTTLNMTGVTLVRARSDYNMLRVGNQYSISSSQGDTGYRYTDIKLIGGTWDGGGYGSTVMKIAHAKNVSLDGVTVQHTVDGHLVEAAATDGLTCTNCTFKDQKVTTTSHICYEAVQLDILVQGHFAGYRAEALPVKNVLFDKCTFADVPRGVGSHTAFLNAPHSNITVQNCTFRNMASCAMQFMYCADVNLTKNFIMNSPRGIAFYGIMPEGGNGIYKASVVSKYNGLPVSLPENYQGGLLKGYTVKDNIIALNGARDSLAGYDPIGICVYGAVVAKDRARNDGSGSLPSGDYYITGAVVSGNVITGKGYGVRLFDTWNTKISNNHITGEIKNDSQEFYAINAKTGCKSLTISGNNIKNSDGNAIYLMDSAASAVSGNQIDTTGKYGISLERATAKKIQKNTITDTAHTAINLLNNCSADTITKNTITNPGKHGIFLQTSKAGKITSNKINGTAKNSSGNGIYLQNGCTAKSISSNTVTNTDKYGIALEKSKATTISKNKVSNTGHTGISLLNKCSANSITQNTITKPAKHGISLVQKCSAKTVTGNKISNVGSGGRAIYCDKSSKITKKQG